MKGRQRVRLWLQVAVLVSCSMVSAFVWGANGEFPIIEAGVLPLRGVYIPEVEVYAKKGKRWIQLAHQIDEKNARGEFVLEGGLPFTANSDDGYFDKNDELIVWSTDLGDAFVDEDVNERLVKNCRKLFRVDVKSKAQSIGSYLVKVARYPSVTSATDAALVHFDAKRQYISTSDYKYEFNQSHPAMLGKISFRDQSSSSELLKDSSFVMPISTPWYLPDMEFKQRDFTSEVESWRVGPIRTIVAVGVKYQGFLGLIDLHLFSELVFYKNRLQIPTIIEFIFSPKDYLRIGSGVAYSLDFADGREWKIHSNLAEFGESHRLRVEKNAGMETDPYWVRLTDGVRSILVEVKVDPRAVKVSPPPMLIHSEKLRSEALKKEFSWLGELSGNLGIYIDFSQVEKGEYQFGLDLTLGSEANGVQALSGGIDSVWHQLPLCR